jgi:hypothetical protein
MDPEKKFNLDELPDEGSSSEAPSLPAINSKKSKPLDPRIEKLKPLKDDERVEEMSQVWKFDRPELLFGWLVPLILLFVLQRSTLYAKFLQETELMNENTMGFASAFIEILTFGVEYLFKNPLVIAIFIPFFFRFRKISSYYFTISFDGISTVKSLKVDTNGHPFRVMVKWHQIKQVEKTYYKRREILRLLNQEGKIAEIIWDIDPHKKRAVKLLTQKMVSSDHPLRKFFEKEIK